MPTVWIVMYMTAIFNLDTVQAAPGWPAVESHASIRGVCIDSDSLSMVGQLFSPTFKLGQRCAPAVLLLHGIPGVEQNTDIAYALRDAGLHCLAIHYRGCWGSPGKLSFASIHQDVVTAYRWLEHRDDVDPDQLVVIGHGIGGYHALKLAVQNGLGVPSSLKGAVALSPLVPDGNSLPKSASSVVSTSSLLFGSQVEELDKEWSSEKALKDTIEEEGLRAAPATNVSTRLPILVVSGDCDDCCSPLLQEQNVVRPLRNSKHLDVRWTRKRHGDHCLSRYRREVVREVVKFAVRCVGLELVMCGEWLGSPWIRAQWMFDIFPLMLIAANLAGFLAGRFSASPEGLALAAAEERAEAHDEAQEDEEDKWRSRSRRSSE